MPKKLPPSLPLSAFSPITPPHLSNHPINARRNTPLTAIDAHVSFRLPDQPSDQLHQLWTQSVSNLRDYLKDMASPVVSPSPSEPQPSSTFVQPLLPPSAFRGFVYIHPQPISAPLSTDNPTETLKDTPVSSINSLAIRDAQQ